jgi:hypothetical protein
LAVDRRIVSIRGGATPAPRSMDGTWPAHAGRPLVEFLAEVLNRSEAHNLKVDRRIQPLSATMKHGAAGHKVTRAGLDERKPEAIAIRPEDVAVLDPNDSHQLLVAFGICP